MLPTALSLGDGLYARSRNSGCDAIQSFPVVISKRFHPIPSRTRKLSSSEPMVLHWRQCGRVGRCRSFLQCPSGCCFAHLEGLFRSMPSVSLPCRPRPGTRSMHVVKVARDKTGEPRRSRPLQPRRMLVARSHGGQPRRFFFSSALAHSTPPSSAPATPHVTTSCPARYRPGTFVFGFSHRCRKRSGPWSSP